MEEPHLLILCTCPDTECGERIARTVVDEHLAACVNLVPGLTSIYRWQGEVQFDQEVLLLIKSHASRYPALESRIRTLHPYDVPEIVATPLTRGLPAYLAWIGESVEAGP